MHNFCYVKKNKVGLLTLYATKYLLILKLCLCFARKASSLYMNVPAQYYCLTRNVICKQRKKNLDYPRLF